LPTSSSQCAQACRMTRAAAAAHQRQSSSPHGGCSAAWRAPTACSQVPTVKREKQQGKFGKYDGLEGTCIRLIMLQQLRPQITLLQSLQPAC
jgi:hypothetical protein